MELLIALLLLLLACGAIIALCVRVMIRAAVEILNELVPPRPILRITYERRLGSRCDVGAGRKLKADADSAVRRPGCGAVHGSPG